MDYQHIETLKPPRMYGHAQIRQFTAKGRVIVEFADLTRESFHPLELELYDRWQESECTLTDLALVQFRQPA